MVDLVNTTSGITRLNNHNYQSWRSCIKSYLEGQDLWEVVNENDTKPPENDYARIKWKVKAGKVMYVLKSTIEDELLQQIKDDDTPKMAWDNFASLFSTTNDAQLQYGFTPVEMNRDMEMRPKLYKAAKEGDVEYLQAQLRKRHILQPPSQDRWRREFFCKKTQYGNNNILHIAARAGQDKFVAKALQYFPFLFDEVNSQRDTPLLVAARFGHLKVVKELTQSSTENGTNSSSSRPPRGGVEELVHHQSEQVTGQVGMTTAAENETNASSSDPQRGAEEDRVDHPMEAGNIPVGMATALENQTNPSSSHPQNGAEEDRVDHPMEAGNIPVGMATALENQTNPSSSHPQRGVEEDRVDCLMEVGTLPVGMATALENQTNASSSDPQSGAEEDRVDHPLEAGNIPVSMATALENQTNSGSSHHCGEVGEGVVDHQSGQGIISDSIVINMEDVRLNSGDMATATEEGPVHLRLDGPVPYHWRVTNLLGTTVTTALHEALRNGHEDVARYLLGLKPELVAFDNLAGESPLFLAAESRCELFMLDIFRSNWRYSTRGPDGLNALHAARYCCGAIISQLIEENRHLMRQLDNYGKAPIHHAVEAEYWFFLRRMLTADASIALFPDADGYTPLLTASKRGCWKICEYILKICPESIEARNHKGQNALHLCQFWTYRTGLRFVKIPEIWELLNVGDDEGNTSLHVAVKENHYEKAMLLTSSVSIDLGAVNKNGLTALDLCESDWRHLNKQRLMWFHLRRYGVPRGRRPNKHMVPAGGPKEVIRSPDEDTKPYINTMSVVAALIATLTFAAAFTMPGGYDSSGEANLVKKAALKVFILSDALAMCCSIAVVSLLWKAMRVEQDLKFVLTNASVILLHISLLATLVAFMSGVFVVIAPKALWVAILACVVCSTVFCLFTPERVQRSSLSTWFMPTIITRDILHFIQLNRRRYKRMGNQRYVLSVIEGRSPDNAGPSLVWYCGSNNNSVVSERSVYMSSENDLGL